MFEHSKSTPSEAFAHYGSALAVLVLVLFWAAYNLGAVFFQLRGAAISGPAVPVFGFLAGTAAATWGLDAVLGGAAWREAGRRGRRVRALILAALLLPGTFCLVSFYALPPEGVPLVNAVQFFLWGTTLPPALRLFFQYVPPARQALFWGIAAAAGQLCWALLIPLLGGPGGELGSVPAAVAARFLPFLNLARCLLSLAGAGLAWKLLALAAGAGERAPDFGASRRPGRGRSPAAGPEKAAWRGRVLCLLLPLAFCFALNGALGYMFFARLQTRGEYLEYLHLVLAVVYPLAGLALARGGSGRLFALTALAVACFSAAPAVFSGLVPLPPQVMYAVCAAGLQLLYFAGVLSLARLTGGTGRPTLLLCLPWLLLLCSVAGNLAWSRLETLSRLPPLVTAWAAALAGATVILLLRRAFPLPPAPEVGADKLPRFAHAFKLTERESQVLAGVLRGLPPEGIKAGLGISESTVRFHLTNLLKKTGQASRRRLTRFYGLWEG